MPIIQIERAGCRSCSLCVEVCPTNVFDMDQTQEVAVAARPEDCVGCASCEYLCPSRCVSLSEVERQRPFHRLEEHARLVSRMLQQEPVAATLTAEDIAVAVRDVSVRLVALGESITDTIGRGHKVVGRKAGQQAAAHLPEVYEGGSLPEVLQRMRRRLGPSFDFEANVAPDEGRVDIRFRRCALAGVVRSVGQVEGQAVLCALFHEYWAGLLGESMKRVFRVEPADGGGPCALRLTANN